MDDSASPREDGIAQVRAEPDDSPLGVHNVHPFTTSKLIIYLILFKTFDSNKI